jgi:hypothetical protein
MACDDLAHLRENTPRSLRRPLVRSNGSTSIKTRFVLLSCFALIAFGIGVGLVGACAALGYGMHRLLGAVTARYGDTAGYVIVYGALQL